ncbi:type II toxin-antitoxin system PemK/MazF family toxin [Methylococcus geothermalis]|uniref:Uncharacterized protein n=1 Tax=Methylococcus geothermalis TaxID=2681310 RepID=A0A858Q6R3_9GAMM|nr:type II toxin-antitoxin system PemK/MazF family toxin [Methylococcus geothermalis]QJD29548.1 hypothetical protein GNH96_05905 [Methylococcus geothermalis]
MTQTKMKSESLPKPIWIRTDKVFTLNLARVVKNVGEANEDVIRQARQAIRGKMGCHPSGIHR